MVEEEWEGKGEGGKGKERGREGKEEGEGREGKGKERGGKGRELPRAPRMLGPALPILIKNAMILAIFCVAMGPKADKNHKVFLH